MIYLSILISNLYKSVQNKKDTFIMDKNVLVYIVSDSVQHKYITIYRYHTVTSAKKVSFNLASYFRRMIK